MSQDVPANRLSTVSTSEKSASTRVTLDLVSHKDSDVEFCYSC